MSSMVSMATPVRPTSPRQRGSSESRPSCVGRSNAMLSPVEPGASRQRERSLDLLAGGVPGFRGLAPQLFAVHLAVNTAAVGVLPGPAQVLVEVGRKIALVI